MRCADSGKRFSLRASEEGSTAASSNADRAGSVCRKQGSEAWGQYSRPRKKIKCAIKIGLGKKLNLVYTRVMNKQNATGRAEVRTYQMVAGNGRPIRKATMVVLADGTEYRFTEKMGKREAMRQVMLQQTKNNWAGLAQ